MKHKNSSFTLVHIPPNNLEIHKLFETKITNVNKCSKVMTSQTPKQIRAMMKNKLGINRPFITQEDNNLYILNLSS